MIPQETRLGIIVHRFLERGYELLHPGYLGVEVKYEHHKHAESDMGKFDQLSVEYASDHSGQGFDRPKSVADAFGKGTASGLSLSKADVYIECIRTWCHRPKKDCPSVCHAPPQPTTEVEKIDFELRHGYVMYVLPVKWLRKAVDQALDDAFLKNMAEPAGRIRPQNEDEKKIAFHNVDDEVASIFLNTYGEDVLEDASAMEYSARLARENVYGKDRGTRDSVVVAQDGSPPGWCAQLSMKEARQHTCVTREECLPVMRRENPGLA